MYKLIIVYDFKYLTYIRCKFYVFRATMTCAQVECPDLFGPPQPEGKQCVKQYRLRDCCSYKEICGKFFQWTESIFNLLNILINKV